MKSYSDDDLRKYMNAQVKAMQEAVKDSTGNIQENCISWIRDNSSIFRESWESSLCHTCRHTCKQYDSPKLSCEKYWPPGHFQSQTN